MSDERALGAAPPPDARRSLVLATRTAVEQVVALFLLSGAFVVWARLMGLSLFGASFAEASVEMRIVLALGAGLLPLAALGMWLGEVWGRVLWLFAVAAHVTALFSGWFPPTTGALVLGFHVVSLALFVAVEIVVLLDARRKLG